MVTTQEMLLGQSIANAVWLGRDAGAHILARPIQTVFKDDWSLVSVSCSKGMGLGRRQGWFVRVRNLQAKPGIHFRG